MSRDNVCCAWKWPSRTLANAKLCWKRWLNLWRSASSPEHDLTCRMFPSALEPRPHRSLFSVLPELKLELSVFFLSFLQFLSLFYGLPENTSIQPIEPLQHHFPWHSQLLLAGRIRSGELLAAVSGHWLRSRAGRSLGSRGRRRCWCWTPRPPGDGGIPEHCRTYSQLSASLPVKEGALHPINASFILLVLFVGNS